ncbi:MAG: hypothetical protein A2790_17665 [Phenylobacterium sp. RIFCSPHIGHO2_01_FULL_69_31]|jgi:hypothetical protein|nr:MAG: hypothetical protein A2790_17665 [Phenylobacterium sp. RIFCSPHIGHO2_01_FULL_69_31]
MVLERGGVDMTDRSHLDEFGASRQDELSKQLIATFIAGHRNPTVKTADLVTRLKDVMEKALQEPADAAESSHRP